MAKIRQLSKEEKACIQRLAKSGMSHADIATIYMVERTTIWRVVKQVIPLSPKKRSGRPRVTSQRTDLRMVTMVKMNPSITSGDLQNSIPTLSNVSKRTIRHRLSAELNLPARRPFKKPLVTEKMRKKRIEFCKKHQDWTEEQWTQVMFSDESMFRQFSDVKLFVRRPTSSNPTNPKYTCKTVKHSPSVMVWGCFSAHGLGDLYFLPKGETMNAKKYLNVLDESLINFMIIHQCTIFQHDSAPCHTAKSVKQWLGSKNIQLLDWPGNSPDLNPIENLWMLIKKRVSAKNCSSLDGLKNAIRHVWCTEITSGLCENLAKSMPKRISAVLKNKGYPTKY